jgi:hypothetical protein
VNALRAWGSDPESAVSEPVGVSHVAVVTADLDGFGAFDEETIGLEALHRHLERKRARTERRTHIARSGAPPATITGHA